LHRASPHVGVGLAIRRWHLSRSETPVPRPVTGALEVDGERETSVAKPRLLQRPRQYPDPEIARVVYGPVLDLRTQTVRRPHVFAVHPPLHDSRLHEVAGNDVAGEPRDRAIRPCGVVELTGVGEERIGGLSPKREDLANREARSTVHR